MTVRAEFLIERQGRKAVLYAGLLDLAHERGLISIETELLQVPDETNGHTAIVKARARFGDGAGVVKSFDGIGDANPLSVGRMIVLHIIRMAETRAKARALRDGTNVGVTAFEELGGDDADETPPPRQPSTIQERAARQHNGTTATAAPARAPAPITEALKHLQAKATELGKNQAWLDAQAKRQFGVAAYGLTVPQARELYRQLIAAADARDIAFPLDATADEPPADVAEAEAQFANI